MKLYKHQTKAVEQFQKRNQILAHDMGLGKTAVAGTIGKGEKSIVLCPAKLKKGWEVELHKIGEKDIQIIKTAKDEIGDKMWTIVSYDVAVVIIEKLINLGAKHLFCDESHYIKGKFRITKKGISGTKRSATAVTLAKEIPHVILLTGTPILNKPIELWNQLVAINAQITRDIKRSTFSTKYCGGHLKTFGYNSSIRFWWENGATHLEELRERIKMDIDIIKKEEVLDLPEKVINKRIIEFTDEEQKEYNTAWNDYLAWVESNPEYSEKDTENVKNAKQLVEIGKLKQITSRVKIKAVLDDIENIDGQIVIFCEYVESLRILNEGLKKKKIKYSTLKTEGSVEKFQEGKVQVFTSNIVAGGTGLNLQNANMVWIVDQNWTPGISKQAEDRIYRIGQDNITFITYYQIDNSIDEKIWKINKVKEKIINKII